MRLADFDYILPKEFIAQYPLKQRDRARLLVVDRSSGSISHLIFKDVVDYINKGDLVALNNTKVLPCRLFGSRITGGKVEVLLLNQKGEAKFNALIRPARLKPSEKIIFNGGKIFACFSAANEVTFNTQDMEEIYKLGVMPLPPYIKRASEDADRIYYQTVYAKEAGAVAAPTAGLHFTEGLIEGMESKGAKVTYLTLHVGYGTFKPVKVEDVATHKMEPEYFRLSHESIKAIEGAKADKKRIIAVGTTSLRALETYAFGRKEGYTDLFIYPGYKFKIVDALITNFHLPRTTLFMLVCAFAGEELAKKAYAQALEEKYRFYSYGDAMLII